MPLTSWHELRSSREPVPCTPHESVADRLRVGCTDTIDVTLYNYACGDVEEHLEFESQDLPVPACVCTQTVRLHHPAMSIQIVQNLVLVMTQ